MKTIHIASEDFEIQHASGSIRLQQEAEQLYVDCSNAQVLAALPYPGLRKLWGYWRRFGSKSQYLSQSLVLRVDGKSWLRLKGGKVRQFAFWKFLAWWLRYKIF